ncbi:HNH endonuclease [Streptomyces hirsutus]|uniref:HNH endonuclease n=1 Tax=Streptomyces hirsutus TaxID=35620 RepID=UPI0033221B73
MTQRREAISEPMKREVRQRCGFGCVVCGKPFYEYDHIEEYSEVKGHSAENLTLLCPDHHSEKTRGLRTRLQVEYANANPFNKVNGRSSPYLLPYGGAASRILVGSNQFVHDIGPVYQEPVVLNGEPVLQVRAEAGRLLMRARFSDSSGATILTIDDNELSYNTDLWDVEFVANRLVVRQAAGKIVTKVVFNPPDSLNVERAFFSHDGLTVKVAPREICYEGSGGRASYSGCSFLNMPYPRGIVMTDRAHVDASPAAVHFVFGVGSG